MVKMLGGVLVLRGVAAAYVAAFKAHSEMYPRIADFDAVFTNVPVCAGNSNFMQVRALRHISSGEPVVNIEGKA
jgi:hypothetical protein